MKNDVHLKLLKNNMTRREFLQFLGGSVLVLLGLGNLLALMGHVKKTALSDEVKPAPSSNGFGTRKFGV